MPKLGVKTRTYDSEGDRLFHCVTKSSFENKYRGLSVISSRTVRLKEIVNPRNHPQKDDACIGEVQGNQELIIELILVALQTNFEFVLQIFRSWNESINNAVYVRFEAVRSKPNSLGFNIPWCALLRWPIMTGWEDKWIL